MKKGRLRSAFKKAVYNGIVSASVGALFIGAGLALTTTGVLAPLGMGLVVGGALNVGAAGFIFGGVRARKDKALTP